LLLRPKQHRQRGTSEDSKQKQLWPITNSKQETPKRQTSYFKHQSPNSKQQAPNGKQQRANTKQQRVSSKQQTANNKDQTSKSNSKQQTTNSKKETGNSKQQTEKSSHCCCSVCLLSSCLPTKMTTLFCLLFAVSWFLFVFCVLYLLLAVWFSFLLFGGFCLLSAVCCLLFGY